MQAADAIGLIDMETGRFVEFNDAACATLGGKKARRWSATGCAGAPAPTKA